MSIDDPLTSLPPREAARRPMTGAEYLESLRDQREVWIYGERVKDVTRHPAFRNQARMVARMYDALHQPDTHAQLTCATDTGSAGYTHRFFKASHNVEELVAARDAIAAWERIGFGWMGRSPGFMGAFTRSEERRVGKECRSRWSRYH